jgi:hypothetical protein
MDFLLTIPVFLISLFLWNLFVAIIATNTLIILILANNLRVALKRLRAYSAAFDALAETVSMLNERKIETM